MSNRVHLLDSSIMIAASIAEHVHYRRVQDWLEQTSHFASCPITQGALIRHMCGPQVGVSISDAKAMLRTIVSSPKHTFWPDDVSYLALPERGLRGHKQVTDFYLAALTGKNGGKLATMDKALAASFPDVCELI